MSATNHNDIRYVVAGRRRRRRGRRDLAHRMSDKPQHFL
jgi:hypothetical protein